MTAPNDEFEQLIKGWNTESPYGGPAQTTKPGLTKRGKVALGVGATVIAGGGLIGYQIHATNEVKAQEIALKTQALEFQKLKEENRANEIGKKAQDSQATARQASIDSCVKSHDDQVGKVLGTTYRDVVDACQAQYAGTTGSDDMQTAASATNATDSNSGGVNQGVLIGGGVLAVALVVAAKKGTRSNPA